MAPGDRIALLGPTSRPLVITIEAIWLAGATLVCLPLPMRLGSIDEFAQQTRQRIRHADVALVIVGAALEPFLVRDAPIRRSSASTSCRRGAARGSGHPTTRTRPRCCSSRPLRDQVVDRGCGTVGFPPREVVLVQAGSLPKASSGKLQRSRCRTQYLDDALAPA